MKHAVLTIGTVTAGASVATATDGPDIDTEFDPSNEEEIRRFAEKFRGLPQAVQRKVYESLSDAQQAGVKKAFAPARFETEVIESSGTVGGQAYETTRSVKLSGYSYLGVHLWDWFHEVNWEHDGSSVWDINSFDYAAVHDSTWSYDGTVSQSLDDDDYEFEAFRQGGLSFIGGGYGFNATPYARVKGYDNGAFEVLEKDDGY